MKNSFLCLLFVGLVTSLFSQQVAPIFHIDRTPEERICHLPNIYFEQNTAEIEGVSMENLAFLAHLMQKNRKMGLKIKMAISPSPDDATHKLLTEERLTFFTWIMEDKFGINPARILKDDYRELSRGYTADQKVIPLERRELLCNCVWNLKVKKQKKRKKGKKKNRYSTSRSAEVVGL